MTHRQITDVNVKTNKDATETLMGHLKLLMQGIYMKRQLLKVCAPEPILEKVAECAPLSPTSKLSDSFECKMLHSLGHFRTNR